MEMLKAVIGGGGSERLRLCTRMYSTGMLQTGVTTALSHAGKFRLGAVETSIENLTS